MVQLIRITQSISLAQFRQLGHFRHSLPRARPARQDQPACHYAQITRSYLTRCGQPVDGRQAGDSQLACRVGVGSGVDVGGDGLHRHLHHHVLTQSQHTLYHLLGGQSIKPHLRIHTPQDCRIECFQAVGGQHHHAREVLQLLQQFIDLAHFPVAHGGLPAVKQAVGFIDEQQGILLQCLGEGLVNALLSLSHPRRQQITGATLHQRLVQHLGQCFGIGRFTRSRWAVQQNATRAAIVHAFGQVHEVF